MVEVFNDVACTVCGCVCDDLTLHTENGRVTKVERGCELSEPWLLAQSDGSKLIAAKVSGKPTELQVAIDEAAGRLRTARAPLIYGFTQTSTAGVRAACQLADRLGATIDSAMSPCDHATMVAMQSAGASTATMGEILHRSDLVVFWGSNPLETHPRQLERFVDAPGMFVPAGRKGRQVVVVDRQPTATSAIADQFVQVARGGDFDLLWALRAAIQGVELHENNVAGVSTTNILALAEQWKAAKYGAFCFGPGLTDDGVPHANVEALLRMVTDLNAHTRAVAQPMTTAGGMSAAEQVLSWQTGYPFGVSLARGFPRYNPREYTANNLLERNEVDAVVLVGSACVGQLSAAAKANLKKLPTVVLDSHPTTSELRGEIEFAVATYGIHRPGTAYRMDHVPLPLRTVLESPLPSDEEILQGICTALSPQQ